MKRLRFRRRRRTSSRRWSTTSQTASIVWWHRKTLGDKLHDLAQRSPRHYVAVEQLVDRVLEKLKKNPKQCALLWVLFVVLFELGC